MFKIRLADMTDMERVFNLSNDDFVRENSVNKSKILWENHVQWFSERIKNTKEPFYVFEDKAGNFVAQVRFNKEDEEFVISVSLEKDFRGKGLAANIIKIASEKFGKYPIVAYIKKNNIPSAKSFAKAGYVPVGEKIINNEKYDKFVLN